MRIGDFGTIAALAFSIVVASADAQQPTALRLERKISGDQLGIGYVGAVTADARGRIYALETTPGQRSIFVFDSTGKSVTRLGRSGQGPGEFQSPNHTLAWMGDTLVAIDYSAQRLTGFDRDGKPVLIRDMPVPSRLIGARGFLFGVTSGTVAVTGSRFVSTGQVLDRTATMGVVKFNRDGSSIMTTIVDTIRGNMGVQCVQATGDELPMTRMPFKNPRSLMAVTPAGEIVRGHLDKYQIDILDAVTGRTLRSIRRDVTPRPLTNADLTQTIEGEELLAFERSGGGKLFGDLTRKTPCPIYNLLPKTGPPLRSVTTDDAGRLWVESMHPTQPGKLALHIYNPAGAVIAETVMPERDMRIAPFVRGERLYAVTTDDMGVHSIAIYRLSL